MVAWGMFLFSAAALGYDDFSAGRIDTDKWRQKEQVRAVDTTTEVLKVVARSEAQGERNRSSFYFPNPERVAAVQVEVVVRELTPAAGSAANVQAEARLHGFFYSTQASPSGYTGNVWAGVGIQGGSGGLSAFWGVSEATSDDLSTNTELGSGVLVAAGSINADTPYILELVHDEAASQFRFAIYDAEGTELGSEVYTYTNRQAEAHMPFLALAAIAYHDSAYSDAEFDNVRTKSDPTAAYSLYDDFTRFDETKWESNQFGRQIENGELVSVVQSFGERETNNLNLEEMPSYLETKIAVSSQSAIDGGDLGVARINGYICNDTVPQAQQTGYTGNVWVNMALRDTGSSLEAACSLSKSLNDDESDWQEIWSRRFDAFDIQYDTAYTLSLEFTGLELIFRLSGDGRTQAHMFALPTLKTLYPAYNEFLGLRTRVYGHTTGGLLKVTFDDVATVSGLDETPRFDASGTWRIEVTPVSDSLDTNTAECELGPAETEILTIRQNGRDFTITNEDGNSFTGRVTADQYPFFGRSYDDEDDVTETINGAIVLSDADHLSGMVNVYSERGQQYCFRRMDLSATKTSSDQPPDDGGGNGGNGGGDAAGSDAGGGGGGGGGCLISTLVRTP
jgi:hypothetical protein